VMVPHEGPVEQVLAGYREYLVLERGLAQSTIEHCLREARLFLGQLPDGLEIGELTAADVSAFLARECPRRTGSGARSLTSKFRRAGYSGALVDSRVRIARGVRALQTPHLGRAANGHRSPAHSGHRPVGPGSRANDRAGGRTVNLPLPGGAGRSSEVGQSHRAGRGSQPVAASGRQRRGENTRSRHRRPRA
jgi:hypothetical protein